jgi:hypothetical protein
LDNKSYSYHLLAEIKEYDFKNESYTTYKFKFTWIYGFLWMTIKGFNLTFAIIIPLYLDKYSLAIIGIAMSILGYRDTLGTISGELLCI